MNSTAADNVTVAASILTGLLKPRLLQQYSNNSNANIVLDNQKTNKIVQSILDSNFLQSDNKEQVEENQQNELIKTDDLHEIMDDKQNTVLDELLEEENSKLTDNNNLMNDSLLEQHDINTTTPTTNTNNLMNSNETTQDIVNNIDEILDVTIEPKNLNMKQKIDQTTTDEINEDQQIDNIVINFQENDEDDDDEDDEDDINDENYKLDTTNY